MAFAGNCGFQVDAFCLKGILIPYLFSEEVGMVIEFEPDRTHEIMMVLRNYDVGAYVKDIGRTTVEKEIEILVPETQGKFVTAFKSDMQSLRQLWEETSHQIDRLQANPECVDQEKINIFDRLGPTYKVSFEPQLTPAHVLEAVKKPKVAILREEGSNGDREMASAFFQAGFEPWDVTMTDLLSGYITLEQFRGVVAVGGFSYADVPESAKGWAATIRFNEKINKMFWEFYHRSDTFSLGVCNGCQLFALLGWVPWHGLSDELQPRFVRNTSGRFESRWSTVRILSSPAIMLQGMEKSVLGVWVAHGEGRLYFPEPALLGKVMLENLAPIVFVDDEGISDGEVSYSYPFNPNGSPFGITGLCSPDGRHLAMMPHPERAFLKWQWPWLPENFKNLEASPWLRMFQNAYDWCLRVKQAKAA
jgi:phosphoribosylformylglycinamidine synthase